MHEQSETIQLPNGEWVNVYGAGTKKAGQRLPDTPTYRTSKTAVEMAESRSRQHGRPAVAATPYEWMQPASLTPEPLPSVPGDGAAAGAPGFSSFQQPVPPEVQAMNVPTTDPREIEVRKEGWMQVLQRVTSDPNLMRAVGFFGAAVGQPQQPGQRLGGHIAQAYTVGQTAYDMGKQSEFDRSRQMKKDALEEESTRATIESRRADTSLARARLPGVQADSEVAAGTTTTRIKEAQTKLDLVNQQLSNAKLTARKADIELKKLEREEAIIAALPPSVQRDSMLAELQKPIAELKRIAAQTTASLASAGASSASARASTALAKERELEVKDLETLTPEERLKRGERKGTGTSNTVQNWEAFKANWKKAHPDKDDKAAAQALDRWISQAKDKPPSAEFTDWAAIYGKGDFDKDLKDYKEKTGKDPYGVAASTTQGDVRSPGTGRTYTKEDLEFTAKKHGITVEEVKRRLGVK